jgi:hypothetical protein
MEDLMKTISRSVLSGRSGAPALALLLLAAAGGAVGQSQWEESAAAQSGTGAAYAPFQYSTITSTWNTINATRVPVGFNGQTFYEDVTLVFTTDATGKLIIAPGYPVTTLSPTLIVAGFKPGKYAGPSAILAGQALITISGPGVTGGGATEWSLAATTGASASTYPNSATFYVGPIASSPLLARIQKAGLSAATQAAWSFGLGGSNSGADGGAWYASNLLLGFSQTANALTIVSFTDDAGNDHSMPVGQITYTLSQ